MITKELWVASDHAGFELKSHLIKSLDSIKWNDLGPETADRVDYPDFADKLVQTMPKDGFGVLVCGSGQGMAMRANKHDHIRAALCWTTEVAELSRQHNNANILCMGERLIEPGLAVEILNTFLTTEFEGGRHAARVEKIGKEV